MSVYVDKSRNPLGRMIMCHMIADTRSELHEMADRLGLKRCWFQDCPPHSVPHYDVSLTIRTNAIHLGAIELDRSEFVAIIRRSRLLGWP